MVASSLLFVFGLALFASKAQALSIDTGIGETLGLGSADLLDVVINVVQWILGLLGLVAVMVMIYGGIIWLTSAGNEQKIAKAKKIIINGLIGLVIILLAWAIVYFVMQVIGNTSGSSGGSCVPACGGTAPYCCAGACQGSPCSDGGGGLPGDFEITGVEVSQDGAGDVYQCSKVKTKFSANVDVTSVDNAEIEPTNPLETVDATNTQFNGDFTTLGSAVTFNHPDLFTINTNFQEEYPELPKTIWDNSSPQRELEGCHPGATGCDDAKDPIIWPFHVGTSNDTLSPSITQAYPEIPGPNQNVSTDPIISVTFSEPIDDASIMEGSPTRPKVSNFILQELDGPLGTDVNTIDNATILLADPITNGFNVYIEDPYLNPLTAFKWYRITVQNAQDLCSNAMSPSSVVWEFETNDTAPGVKSWYPQGTNECPDVDAYLTFNTSMYNNEVKININSSSGDDRNAVLYPSLGIVSDTTTQGDIFQVEDQAIPPMPVSDYYKVFKFDTITPFDVNSDYLVTVTTDMDINIAGDHLQQVWNFTTSDPDHCVCAPYVSRLDPGQGSKESCLTASGACFTGTAANPAIPTKINFYDGVSADGTIGGYDDDYITTTLPDIFDSGDRPAATVEITYSSPLTFGTLTSQSPGPSFYINSNTIADGPCLWSVSPNSGLVGYGVNLSGIRFKDSPTGTVNFIGEPKTTWDSWSDTFIHGYVPTLASDGDVTVSNDIVQKSNGIYFDVLQIPPGTPYVIVDSFCDPTASVLSSPSPWFDQEEICLNSRVSTRFNESMDADTLNTANILVQKCTAATGDPCTIKDPTDSGATITVGKYNVADDYFVFKPNSDFEPDKWYEATITTDVKNASGINMAFPFIWRFKTKDSAGPCPLEGVAMNPRGPSTINWDGSQNYNTIAMGPNCQIINADDYTWSWNSTDMDIAQITGTPDTYQATVISSDYKEGSCYIQATAESKTGQSKLNVDLTDCQVDPTICSRVCSYSECIDGRCTPIIETVDPPEGPVGQYVTVTGCMFGEYSEGKSKVVFLGGVGVEGKIPEACESELFWANDSITIEVPEDDTPTDTSDDAQSGPIAVTSKYGSSYYDATNNGYGPVISDFIINSAIPPLNLCPLIPSRGKNNSPFTAIGEGFDRETTGDNISFYDVSGRVNAPITSWLDTEIKGDVPPTAVTSESSNGVYVVADGVSSNPQSFTVTCSNGSDCATGCCWSGECALPAYCSTGTPGDLCQIPTNPNCLVGPLSFLSGYDCFSNTGDIESTSPPPPETPPTILSGDDCRVCCEPGKTSGQLTCVENKDNCTGTERGLYCGCTNDSDCGSADTIGCGKKSSPYCCYQRPKLDSTNPAPAEEICRNRVAEATFDQIMDTTTFTKDNVQLQYYTAGDCAASALAPEQKFFARLWNLLKNIHPSKATAAVWCDIEEIDISFYRDRDKTVLTVWPSTGVFPASTGINVKLKYDENISDETAAGLLNQYGVGVNGQSYTDGWYEYEFNTSAILCELDHVDVTIETALSSTESNFDLYTCNNNQCAEDLDLVATGNQHRYVAHARDKNDEEIAATYLWTDTILPPDLSDVVHLDDPGDIDTFATSDFTIHPKSGTEYAEVEADAGAAGKKTVSVQATVNICENPWPENNPYYYPDSFLGQTENTNFLTYFCKDGLVTNPADLTVDYLDEPHNGIYTVSSGDDKDSLMREVFFKVAESGEHLGVIGIRVYENELKVPPADWYAKQFPQEGLLSGGTIIDNYQAVAVGRTIYVDAANSDAELYLNVYLMSYDEGADAIVRDIYDQLVENWYFNTNLDANKKPALARDTFRVMNLGGIANALINYKETNGFYPELEAGSYVERLTTSEWPSWQARLGNELGGTLPVDPVGNFGACGTGYDPDTCWNETDKKYYCPTVDSRIYQYMFDNGEAYLYANLEYDDDPNWKNFTSGDPCDSPHSCDCFNYLIKSADGFFSYPTNKY